MRKGLNKERRGQGEALGRGGSKCKVQRGTNKLGLLRNFRKKPVWEVKNEHRKHREGVTWATT